MAEKSLAEFELSKSDYSYIREVFMQADFGNIKKRAEAALQMFVKDYYENDRGLFHYLSGAVADIVDRLKNAADNNVLESII